MHILKEAIGRDDLNDMIGEYFDDMIKGVADVERELLAINAELHADLEAMLLEDGSKQENLWGINLYPEIDDIEDFLEFDSLINIRPRQGNRSWGVEDEKIREKIRNVVEKWVRE